jgi:hypothetical protein
MAGVTVHPTAQVWPASTSVAAYPMAPATVWMRGRRPPTPLTATATASVDANGVLAFTGLTAGQVYAGYAQVSGEDRWMLVGQAS